MATNYALSSNGSTATATDTFGASSPSKAIDGSRLVTTWPNDAWNSATTPQTLTVDFNASRTIVEVDIITLPDSVTYGTQPTLSDTFTLYGITAYTVQYWNGTTWVNLFSPVTGNDKVWRQHTFAAVTTTKIRITVNGSVDGQSRLVELEAWSGAIPVITSTTLPDGTLGTAYNQTPTSTGTPTSWAKTSGTLPTGLSLNTSTGAITGTPITQVGTFTFTLTATNAFGTSTPVTLTITIGVSSSVFPTYAISGVQWRHWDDVPKDYATVTDSYEFEDGGMDFNERGTPPKIWMLDRDGATKLQTDIFDAFWDAVRLTGTFSFTDKYGTTWTGVQIKEYSRSHDAHKSWSRTLSITLVKYPS